METVQFYIALSRCASFKAEKFSLCIDSALEIVLRSYLDGHFDELSQVTVTSGDQLALDERLINYKRFFLFAISRETSANHV